MAYDEQDLVSHNNLKLEQLSGEIVQLAFGGAGPRSLSV